ncbi:MAG: hypothetical protein BJBARM4_0528 [Candidatus Parvarchaeum acidiphilum ARMAN-4]|jgi:phage-related holin|uniref:Uncharacterized protein n=1 Tax=Candidatus Parvarchaeum acidiphilum ARMAN-4 TaxID=662760 RepID=D2EFL0_PARA4|nr:hypothetical protein [Candidatus Parvarchaeum acidiphilum ARMAN-4]EEZ92907.1 MAG: hypothetical protein BJBARM4_0528 [Candidatus Parvarchaeum acidiphilum ARMAN-4]
MDSENLTEISELLKNKIQKMKSEDSISRLSQNREIYHEFVDFLSTAKNIYPRHANYFDKKLERMDFPGLKKSEALAVIEYTSNLFETESIKGVRQSPSALKMIGIIVVVLVVVAIVGAYFLSQNLNIKGTTISGQTLKEFVPVLQNSTVYITAQNSAITLNLSRNAYLRLDISGQSNIITLNSGYVYLTDSGQLNVINVKNTTLLSDSDSGQGNTINTGTVSTSPTETVGNSYNSTTRNSSGSSSGSTCLSSLQVSSYTTESTGGTCTNYVVQMGSYSRYTNYQNACPSIVQGGSYDTYYNNVSGCNPTIQLGSGSKSCYLGSCS